MEYSELSLQEVNRLYEQEFGQAPPAQVMRVAPVMGTLQQLKEAMGAAVQAKAQIQNWAPFVQPSRAPSEAQSAEP